MKNSNRTNLGLIDYEREINFKFDGKSYKGYQGDTLASALLANGVKLIGRSFKYHRPRGILTSGSEEPNALVELSYNNITEPNTKATTIELYEGLIARSQNCWPSLKYDFMSINDKFPNLLSAGFYYKTFMWPSSFWEKLYEPLIRKAAGLGKLSTIENSRSSEKGFLHCDLLVIGSGPSGLISTYIAGLSGAKVILVEEDYVFGGNLNNEIISISGSSSHKWVDFIIDELKKLPNVRLMLRTCAIGMFDHGVFGVIEKFNKSSETKISQIFWKVTSKKAMLCTGALERIIPFSNNDRPGIMLSGSIRSYLNRWGVVPSNKVAIFTNNDDAYVTAKNLISFGVNVVGVIDSRENPKITDPNIKIFKGSQVINSKGKLALKGISVLSKEGKVFFLECNTLGVSGGWNPNLQLSCHTGVKPEWQNDISAFIPGKNNISTHLKAVGAANGNFTLDRCMISSEKAILAILEELKIKVKNYKMPDIQSETYNIQPFWYVQQGNQRKWIDFQNDVTVKDIELAYKENFRSVEHLKRYTTLGMGTDQGKTSNVTGLAILATLSNKTIPEVGTTIFRPPYVPVSLDAFVGSSQAKYFKPTRLTPTHDWAEKNRASFVETGLWIRAEWYSKETEKNWRQTVDREVNAVRNSVGFCDVSTLGKIDIQGKDSQEFINKVYCNGFSKLAIGKVRYGLMLREDGLVMDDGTTARMSENHFIMTTTTVNAESVYRHLEFCHQCLWPEMDVQLISTTDAWSQIAIAGPNSRKVISKIIDTQFDVSNENFPFMACKEISICGGFRARLFRISFSGELAYEISIPSQYASSLVSYLMEVGKEENITPYGTEALGVMRIEKGHAAGPELNGTVTALNLNMGKMVSSIKDSIGMVLSKRVGLNLDNGPRLVGFKPIKSDNQIISGSHIFNLKDKLNAENDLGYITSSCYSPTLNSYIALGFLKDGNNRYGDKVKVSNPLFNKEFFAEVCNPIFIDPNGDRLRE
ncbi:sarcosine oxidase subunit alpha family protein [Alphaproteobacteria bacterium]|nr:sarcosine oxidase subunit alpha family protein [Alphaproteobacteria bacterium]